MPVSELLMEGVKLMVLGMGIVFTFLAILVVALNGMTRLAKVLDERAGNAPAPAGPPSPTLADSADSELLAVIGAAIARYRSGRP